MLLQLCDFITRERVVSLQQLAREFHVDELALQPMLDIWIQRGVLRIRAKEQACQSTCFRCDTGALLYYEAV